MEGAVRVVGRLPWHPHEWALHHAHAYRPCSAELRSRLQLVEVAHLSVGVETRVALRFHVNVEAEPRIRQRLRAPVREVETVRGSHAAARPGVVLRTGADPHLQPDGRRASEGVAVAGVVHHPPGQFTSKPEQGEAARQGAFPGREVYAASRIG